ncbi:MAG: NAD(P)-dependent oxidoreductase [Spirochaetales bacterium]|uniref:NAD(P)-dependent oxidoreductase n=1 Tax=Candidatus Thalassospirochaeta sargassi TaxID=3119039 RepID=A0AAJ1MJY9_9SPIO|nr:NAD(P)-dependent oxidoreductase [Spirochaetales bacterium]
MSENAKKDYLCEAVPAFNIATAMEEASRCLLCLDAPCSQDCPAGTNPGDFIRAIRFRNFKGAAEIIRTNNVLGGICARVCPYEVLCEKGCSRSGIDKPIQIGRLQRFATDYEKASGFQPLEKVEATKEKVAMIGSGPASLTCGAELAQKGYDVTIFEEKAIPGGVLSYGVVPARLPQYIVDEEIETIKNLGVKIECNTKIGKDKTIDALKAEGFKAFFVGAGIQAAKMLDVPGVDLDGVTNAVEYLGAAKPSNGDIDPGNKVVVIGGGDVAMDCATTARLLGAEKTMILYRRTREEAPAHKIEMSYVEELGVHFHYGFTPVEIIGENGKVTAIKGKGFRDDSIIQLECDKVVFAIGQAADESVKEIADLKFTPKNTIIADETKDCKTDIPYIFAGGDIVNGGNTVVQAVAVGKTAAESIDKYLSEEAK